MQGSTVGYDVWCPLNSVAVLASQYSHCPTSHKCEASVLKCEASVLCLGHVELLRKPLSLVSSKSSTDNIKGSHSNKLSFIMDPRNKFKHLLYIFQLRLTHKIEKKNHTTHASPLLVSYLAGKPSASHRVDLPSHAPTRPPSPPLSLSSPAPPPLVPIGLPFPSAVGPHLLSPLIGWIQPDLASPHLDPAGSG